MEILQKAWVFVMPSIKEGWGITIMEAASCGTPCVGFNVSGVKDSIVDGKTGYLALNPKDYLDKVLNLLEDRQLRNSLAKNCTKWSAVFSWDASADIYSQIIDGYSNRNRLMANKLYPWELDLRSEAEGLLE